MSDPGHMGSQLLRKTKVMANHLAGMDRIAIIGASMTQFGVREGSWIRDLLSEAAMGCIETTGISPRDIDHVYVSNMASGECEGQTGIMNALVHDIGAVPAYTARIDQTSASGGAGIYAAWQSVASGQSDMTLLVGGEKMTHTSTSNATDIISTLTHPVEYKHGVTLPSFAGLITQLYLHKYNALGNHLPKLPLKTIRMGLTTPMHTLEKK